MAAKCLLSRVGTTFVPGVVCLLMFFVPGCLAPGGIMPPPERVDVADTWIAAEGNWAFFRVALQDGGTGLLGATFHSDSPMIYRVTSWRLTDTRRFEKGDLEQLRELTVAVEPVGAARPLRVKGWAGKHHLRLRLAWEGWSPRWATFYHEDALTERAKQTRSAMLAHEQKASGR